MKRSSTMRLLVTVLTMVSILANAWAEDTVSELEKMAKDMVLQPPDYKKLGVIFIARTNAPNTEIMNHIINGVAAGLTAVSKGDIYAQRIRQFVADPGNLESSLNVPCPKCDTVGAQTFKCSSCNGIGICKNTGCTNGRTIRPVMNGGNVEVDCVVCKGSGKCPKCQGEGKTLGACPACSGKKTVFSPNQAATVYTKELQAALAGFAAIRDEKQNRIKLAEEGRVRAAEVDREKKVAVAHADKLRQAEIDGKKIAAVAEGEALGKERARLAVEEERSRAEKVESKKYAERDKQFLPSIVLIEGEHSVGTGFFCTFKGKKVVLSNAHVLCGNFRPVIKTLSNETVSYSRIQVCKIRDVVIYELSNPDRYGALTLHDGANILNNQEEVVVFGNSGGGGVVTTLRGNMRGIGPDKIEVDATFISGNSGSPIIAYEYSNVVGIATYVQSGGKVDWVTRKTRFEEVRRFGVRVDNLDWSDFDTLNMEQYKADLDVVESIKEFAINEVMKAKYSGYYSPSRSVVQKASDMESEYKKLPNWIQQYSTDAQEASLICGAVQRLGAGR